MDTAAIVTHIKPDLLAAGFAVVQSALSVEAIPNWYQLPAAFVHPVKDVARGGNRFGTYAHAQTVDEQFAVVTVCAIDELETWRGHVRDKLIAGPLPGRVFETDFIEGEILDLNRTAIWWRDVYGTAVERRST